MDESIRKALEENSDAKIKQEIKGETDEEKILSFFKSATSDDEKRQRLKDAVDWFSKEHRCHEIEAFKYVKEVIDKNHVDFPKPKGGCVVTILIAMTSTLSLMFLL